MGLAQLLVAAAVLRLERWRFTYSRKLTPQRISDFTVPRISELEKWVEQRLLDVKDVIDAALRIYL